jgi:hypothetical protein
MNTNDERCAGNASALKIQREAKRLTEKFFAGEPVEKRIWIKRFQKFRRQVAGI